jgi:hypothetical protein
MYFSFTFAILSGFWIVFEKFLILYGSLGYFRVVESKKLFSYFPRIKIRHLRLT